MNEVIQQLITAKQEATKKLEDAILAEIDRVARETNIKEISYGLATFYTVDGEHAEYAEDLPDHEGVQQAVKLEELYCDEVHASGFQAVWKKDGGWG